MPVKLWRAFLGGLLGTIAINLVAYTAYPLAAGGVPLDIAGMLGGALGDNWVAGLIADFVIGTVIAPALYVGLFHWALPRHPHLRGTLWGIMVWAVALGAVSRPAGGGPSFRGLDVVPAAVGALAGAILYGVVYGFMFEGAPHPRPARRGVKHPNVFRAG